MHRAQSLLLLDRGKQEKEIAEFLSIDYKTLWRLKKKYLALKDFVDSNVLTVLQDEPRSGQPSKYTQNHHTELVALACSNAPEGRVRWTLELLTEAMRTKEGCSTMNRESIRLVLKKTNVSLG